MSQLTYKEHQIDQRDDSYVNLSQMAKANKARIDKYLSSPETQKYLKAAQESISPDSGLLTEVVQTLGFGRNKATWGHPLVALHLGQWISPEFHVWCNQNIHTLMTTGTVSIDATQSEITKLETQSKRTFPRASVDPIPGEIAPMSERAICNRLVREYVFHQTTTQPQNEQDVWRWMYRELKYRYHYDVYARVKKTGLKKLDQCAVDGQLPNLLAICNHFLDVRQAA